MAACEGKYTVTLKLSRSGFESEEEARKDAYRRIQRKVNREKNHEGWCDGDCPRDDETECMATYAVAQRNEAVEVFTYSQNGNQLYGYDTDGYALDVKCRCV